MSPSFPTRRSSDLGRGGFSPRGQLYQPVRQTRRKAPHAALVARPAARRAPRPSAGRTEGGGGGLGRGGSHGRLLCWQCGEGTGPRCPQLSFQRGFSIFDESSGKGGVAIGRASGREKVG